MWQADESNLQNHTQHCIWAVFTFAFVFVMTFLSCAFIWFVTEHIFNFFNKKYNLKFEVPRAVGPRWARALASVRPAQGQFPGQKETRAKSPSLTGYHGWGRGGEHRARVRNRVGNRVQILRAQSSSKRGKWQRCGAMLTHGWTLLGCF
jgi:hypothetical protein